MLSRSESRNVEKKLNPQKIYFSQQSVSECFTDGQPLADVVQALVEGNLSFTDIPSIRVVWVYGGWMTLDNRRLRVFRDACVQEIDVIVCSLSDPVIKHEFDLKRTNKTITSGGVVRDSSYKATSKNYASKDHFEEGVFVFTKKILNWNLTQVKTPHFNLTRRKPLTDGFHHENEYFDGFTDLILEEARAVLDKGIALKEESQSAAVHVELVRYKFGKNPENPSPLYFRPKSKNNETLKSGDVVLLIYQGRYEGIRRELGLLGMATYVNPQEQDYQICLKVVVAQADRQEHYKAFATVDNRNKSFKVGANQNNRQWYNPVWEMYPIGSLITHLRMYDACLSKTSFPFIKEIMSGKLEPEYQKQENLERFVEEKCKNLNQSQKAAVKSFVCLEKGLQLVQGPPGTGKTTTLVQLLSLSCDAFSRTLVSASSNKAVQILAERFLEICPDVPVVLVGVEDKLPENSSLNNIFIHTWKKQTIEMIATLQTQANALQKPILSLEAEEVAQETQEQKKQPHVNKKKLTHQKISEMRKTVEKLKINVSLLVAHLNFFKLDFSKKFIEEHAVFLTSLNKYQSLLPEPHKESGSFEPSAEWIAKQRKYLGKLFRLLSGLQMTLQLQTDEAIELALMNASLVIFATLSVTGRKLFKDKNLRPIDALIIDEAGQAIEAETLIALQTNPQKCLLVGDTKQLSATVISEFSRKLKFDRSLLWRLMEDCQQNYSFLDEQYRMNPEISAWPSQKYYEKKLKNGPNTLKSSHTLEVLKNAPPFFGPYAFIDVAGREERGKSFSLFNAAESDAVVSIVHYLDKQYQVNIVKQVGIITFYKAQEENISKKLSPRYPNINVKTVDGFQGGENDIIIISFVRANVREKIGFLSDFRRLNVALTRAKYALLMVGDRKTLESSDHDVAELIQNAVERNKVFSYHEISPLFHEKTEEKKPLPKNQKKPRRPGKSTDFKQQSMTEKPEFNQNKDLQQQTPNTFFPNPHRQTSQRINVPKNQRSTQGNIEPSKDKIIPLFQANTQERTPLPKSQKKSRYRMKSDDFKPPISMTEKSEFNQNKNTRQPASNPFFSNPHRQTSQQNNVLKNQVSTQRNLEPAKGESEHLKSKTEPVDADQPKTNFRFFSSQQTIAQPQPKTTSSSHVSNRKKTKVWRQVVHEEMPVKVDPQQLNEPKN